MAVATTPFRLVASCRCDRTAGNVPQIGFIFAASLTRAARYRRESCAPTRLRLRGLALDRGHPDDRSGSAWTHPPNDVSRFVFGSDSGTGFKTCSAGLSGPRSGGPERTALRFATGCRQLQRCLDSNRLRTEALSRRTPERLNEITQATRVRHLADPACSFMRAPRRTFTRL